MKLFTVPSFWDDYEKLPANIKALADKNFDLLKNNPNHPSLRLKKVGRFWSLRIGLNYRASSVEFDDGVLWFWMGRHTTYDKILKNT